MLAVLLMSCAARNPAKLDGDDAACPTSFMGSASVAVDDRYHAGVSALDELQSSKEHPVEVCGVTGQVGWLLRSQCANGAPPFTDPDVAHGARVGNVGAGGRCGSIVDLYAVTCPEGTYEVYMDLYVCDENDN
jgi:hypothetical protein